MFFKNEAYYKIREGLINILRLAGEIFEQAEKGNSNSSRNRKNQPVIKIIPHLGQ
jgi:hypothetical protein